MWKSWNNQGVHRLKLEQRVLLLAIILAVLTVNRYFLGTKATVFLTVVSCAGFALWYVMDLVQAKRDKSKNKKSK